MFYIPRQGRSIDRRRRRGDRGAGTLPVIPYRWRMDDVSLTGYLVCKDAQEAGAVVAYLPRHVALTRQEPGCVSFDVTPTDDPLIWRVEERFRDEAAFALHQERVAWSEWGRMTDGIERRYVVHRQSD